MVNTLKNNKQAAIQNWTFPVLLLKYFEEIDDYSDYFQVSQIYNFTLRIQTQGTWHFSDEQWYYSLVDFGKWVIAFSKTNLICE